MCNYSIRAMEIEWINYNVGHPRIVGVNSLGRHTANHVLQGAIDVLETKRGWGIAHALATILRRLANTAQQG